jgi:hypothetical protein
MDKRTYKRTNIYSIFRDKLSLPEGSSDYAREVDMTVFMVLSSIAVEQTNTTE